MSNLPLFIGLRFVGARERALLVAFLSRVSMAGLVVGVGLLIVVLSIMNGFDRELRERILNLLPQASVYHRQGVDDWQSLQILLEQNSHIVAAAPFVEIRALVGVANKAKPVGIYGISPEAEMRVSEISQYIAPSILNALNQGGIILGRDIANSLSLVAGDTVMLVVPNPENPKAAPAISYVPLLDVLHTQTEVDNQLALMGLNEAAKLSANKNVTGMRLKLDDLFNAHAILWDVVMSLGRGYYGNSWLSTHGNLHHAIQMSKSLVGLLMSLIVGIAAFNVVSTLIMVVVEKQGAIAILRTLGASTGVIMAIFMVQGTMIGCVGALAGAVLGIGLSLVVGKLLAVIENILGLQFLQSDVYPLTYLPIDVLWTDVLQVVGIAIGLCFLATIYPAWRASRIRPAEALRYE